MIRKPKLHEKNKELQNIGYPHRTHRSKKGRKTKEYQRNKDFKRRKARLKIKELENEINRKAF